MAKPKKQFVCSNCSHTESKWSGQCTACEEWNTMEEGAPAPSSGFQAARNQDTGGRVLTGINLANKIDLPDRIKTNIGELDSVLGGGGVPGSAVLISGEPGIGKSTLLIQAIASIADIHGASAYFSGEEAETQIGLRAQRLGLQAAPVSVFHESNVRDIIATCESIKPKVIIIDSIQTMRSDAVEGAAGGIAQIKASSEALIKHAKAKGYLLIIVGHVNKDGDLAGPRHLEHMVDAVLSFEGDRNHQYRILKAVKNRYGATDEVGVFEMTDKGLKEVNNPSSLFLVDRDEEISGACVFPTIEGGRAILVEVQALCVKRGDEGYAKRACVGWDKTRLDMILAVLEARFGFAFMRHDVYLNIAGGYRLSDPGADLAIAAALISAITDKPMDQETIAFGEVALSGDIRPVQHMALRLREASKLGFKTAFCPRINDDISSVKIYAKQNRSMVGVISAFIDLNGQE